MAESPTSRSSSVKLTHEGINQHWWNARVLSNLHLKLASGDDGVTRDEFGEDTSSLDAERERAIRNQNQSPYRVRTQVSNNMKFVAGRNDKLYVNVEAEVKMQFRRHGDRYIC